MKPKEKLLSPKEVALLLNVSMSTVYRYLGDTKNPLPSYKISKSNIRISKLELDQWLELSQNEN